MRSIKKFYYDLETTGVDRNKSAIHQIAILVEIDGRVVSRHDWNMKPFEGATIEAGALKVGGVTEDTIRRYPSPETVYKELIKLLSKHVDKYNKLDKFYLTGFNNRSFDDQLIRAWFERMGDQYYGSWFWSSSLDVMVLASQHLLFDRWKMINFKLGTVAETLGVEVDKTKLHDGLYDVEVTREIYNKITNADLLG